MVILELSSRETHKEIKNFIPFLQTLIPIWIYAGANRLW